MVSMPWVSSVLAFVLAVPPASPSPGDAPRLTSARDRKLTRAMIGWGVTAAAGADVLLASGVWFALQGCLPRRAGEYDPMEGDDVCNANGVALAFMAIGGFVLGLGLVGLSATAGVRAKHRRQGKRWGFGPGGSMLTVRF